MWAFAVVLFVLIALLVRGLCRMATESERQECQEMRELLARRNIREGNSVE